MLSILRIYQNSYQVLRDIVLRNIVKLIIDILSWYEFQEVTIISIIWFCHLIVMELVSLILLVLLH